MFSDEDWSGSSGTLPPPLKAAPSPAEAEVKREPADCAVESDGEGGQSLIPAAGDGEEVVGDVAAMWKPGPIRREEVEDEVEGPKIN